MGTLKEDGTLDIRAADPMLMTARELAIDHWVRWAEEQMRYADLAMREWERRDPDGFRAVCAPEK